MVVFRIDNIYCKYLVETLVELYCKHSDMKNNPNERHNPTPICIEEDCPLLKKVESE